MLYDVDTALECRPRRLHGPASVQDPLLVEGENESKGRFLHPIMEIAFPLLGGEVKKSDSVESRPLHAPFDDGRQVVWTQDIIIYINE